MRPPTKSRSKFLTKSVAAAAGLAVALSAAGTASAMPFGGHSALPFGGFAHRTVTAADGETFHLKLAAGPTVLPASERSTVQVKGAGYNRAQGIFLAFCVIPDGVRVGDPSTYTSLPSPCLPGGETKDGSSRRITDTGTGTPDITFAYEEGGAFRTTLENIRPEIRDGVVCDVNVRCAIVTRADFTATNERLYDQYIPVHFVSDSKD
ncbi:hypothetical protein [Streptomyces chartreusis]|uniref:Twin-arginine translocation signal domain-containing protein n=1 Tax=Streptomyces chartreusis TaxID=1969 RepID=A0A7H8TIS3_STRCX|nr:hypothetical protein [Streptomyces chartreusis]QKZ23416.1 hypothetical protein HUT05_42290 [Streptomyces chartreusis]